ncbi:GntR family transcriptional regulator [Citreicella sp. C3M06]|uniref:GntR family transcriptional regulator n=1 Tax=Citreicella sp. C3M06 TaxID=2841564 RepID=UPI001C097643|nr:GntR family transcriptional regulator [Citreicella sp. C3M06]MBU2961159.1 GntR family transcriptional regulator [Citreicella sp. C3M06]
MSRENRTLKAAVNAALDHLGTRTPGDALGSEADLAARLSISRTTARGVLAHLAGAGVIAWEGRDKTLLRAPCPEDRFAPEETAPAQERAEARFLEWILRTDLAPGARINETDLARQIKVPTATVRDLLLNFRTSGLIEKNPNKHWTFLGFTRDYAVEMCDMRELIERAALACLTADPAHPSLPEIREMERLHIALLARDDSAMSEFPALDARFHRIVCEAANNRFFDEFSHRISIIVHYHYQWNKRDEITRNRAAIREHLSVIQAILQGDSNAARGFFDDHLTTARKTLLASMT